jgi:CDP-diacylglycerol---glycerol-3-phosphate 3-phosphatidyltransferase
MSLLYVLRPEKDRALTPVSLALSSSGITPNIVTATGLLVSVAAGLVAASGHLYAGIVLFSAGACCDLVDGSLARVSGHSSEFGRYFDSTCDRLSETAFISGAIVGGVPWLAAAVIAGSVLLMASRIYNHRKGLGSNAAMFGRPERLLLLVAGLLVSSPVNAVLFVANALLCIVSSGQVLASGARADNRP